MGIVRAVGSWILMFVGGVWSLYGLSLIYGAIATHAPQPSKGTLWVLGLAFVTVGPVLLLGGLRLRRSGPMRRTSGLR